MPYILLCFSVTTEVFATTMMKLSEGFTVLGPSICVVISYTISFSLLIVILKHMPLGLVYGIWGGAGTALTALVGVVMWGEPFTLFTGLGLSLIVAGIVLLNKGSQDELDNNIERINESLAS